MCLCGNRMAGLQEAVHGFQMCLALRARFLMPQAVGSGLEPCAVGFTGAGVMGVIHGGVCFRRATKEAAR